MSNNNIVNDKVNKIVSNITTLYFIMLIFTYSYGIEITNNKHLRIADFIFIILTVTVIFLLFNNRSTINFKSIPKILLIITFGEFVFYIFAVIYYNNIFELLSGLRIVYLYLPMILISLFNSKKLIENLDIKLKLILKIVVLINLIYSIIQILAIKEYLPELLLISKYLSNFAVDDFYNAIDGFRSSGLFLNSTRLSIFAITSFSYFLSKYIYKENSNLLFGVLSYILIILSDSRIAILSALLIFIFIFFNLKKKKKIKIIKYFIIGTLILLVFIYVFIGLENFFYRSIRLVDQNQEDFSKDTRITYWKNTIKSLEKYPYGTLTLPVNKLETIDSGYLTYYAQGKFILLFILFIFLFGIIKNAKDTYHLNNNWTSKFLISISIYLFLSMITTNPLHTPHITFVLSFILIYNRKWYLDNSQYY